MHELRRLAYLEAMGVDGYVSRGPLPGAAPTRRLALLRPVSPQASVPQAPPVPDMPSFEATQKHRTRPSAPAQARPAGAPVAAAASTQRTQQVERFSLAAVVAGEWLWLEDLGEMPMSQEQVWLISAMARALALAAARSRGEQLPAPQAGKPNVAQFDWPIHTNEQFDLGDAAAQASVAGFVSRRLEQFRCTGVVLLGKDSQRRLAAEDAGVPVVATVSAAQLLADPTLKATAWRDLAPLRRK